MKVDRRIPGQPSAESYISYDIIFGVKFQFLPYVRRQTTLPMESSVVFENRLRVDGPKVAKFLDR